MNKKIEIFTDGSCLGNPGPGGYAIIFRYKKYHKELSAGYILTTNNRMELMAAIIALETLKKKQYNIFFYTDSQYLIKGITDWIILWKKNNWQTSKYKSVKNNDLWKRLEIAIKNHKIHWNWLKGHTGHIDNERCNILAKNAAKHPVYQDIIKNANK